MELHGADFLIDYLDISNESEHWFDMRDLSTSSVRALTSAMVEMGNWPNNKSELTEKKFKRPIEVKEISQLLIQDIRDMRHIGEGKVIKLINELVSSINSFEDFKPIIYEDDELGDAVLNGHEAAIEEATSLHDLAESMFNYVKFSVEEPGLKDSGKFVEVDSRTEVIWRNRLPWLCDSLETFDYLGKKFNISRQRVNQIQNKARKIVFRKDLEVKLLSNIQEILLNSMNFADFVEVLLEDGIMQEPIPTIGRIRFVALELGYKDLADDIEKAVYRWSVPAY